jgi:hypothetical protein
VRQHGPVGHLLLVLMPEGRIPMSTAQQKVVDEPVTLLLLVIAVPSPPSSLKLKGRSVGQCRAHGGRPPQLVVPLPLPLRQHTPLPSQSPTPLASMYSVVWQQAVPPPSRVVYANGTSAGQWPLNRPNVSYKSTHKYFYQNTPHVQHRSDSACTY